MEFTITFDGDKDGNLVMGVKDVKGGACEDVTADITRKLGGQVLSSKKTAEFYEEETQDHAQRINNRS